MGDYLLAFIAVWLFVALMGFISKDRADAARWRRLMAVRKDFTAERLGNAIIRARFDDESA